jgi:N-hydroxyarylamine O-acetyltransferase
MPSLDPAPDLDAYFSRIGYAGSRAPTLATLHAVAGAHAQAIPFENLDVLLGRPIYLDAASIQKKLVHDRRGGYCFEQNGLLLLMLEALGFRVTPIGARVRLQTPRHVVPPRTHLFVRVELDGEFWLIDAGVGGLSLTSAIRLDESGREQTTPHELRRIVREDGRLFHQARLGAEWTDVCEFTLEEMYPIDRELANWWTSASPTSRFKSRLVAARAAPDGKRLVINDRELSIRSADGQAEKHLIETPDELLLLLALHFNLRFPPGTRFGPPGSPWPS